MTMTELYTWNRSEGNYVPTCSTFRLSQYLNLNFTIMFLTRVNEMEVPDCLFCTVHEILIRFTCSIAFRVTFPMA